MIPAALERPDVRDLLVRPLVARLATIDDAGYPAIVPVWFEWAGGRFSIVARARAAYVADVRARPRVGLSIVDDRDPDRRLQVRGIARLAADPGPLVGTTLALARRLASRYEGDGGLEYIEQSRSWPRVLVRIEPERALAWTSDDWHPRYHQRFLEETE
jgi:PPOX class probable F420-dependent enzyme